MKNKLLKVTGVCFLLLLGIFLGVYGITYITKASMPTSYGVYFNESLASAIDGKTYTWCKNTESAKITDASGNKIYTTNAGTQSDSGFDYNSTTNPMYVNWGYPEFTTIGYQKDAVQGVEMILANSVTVKDYYTFTFEIGMKTSNSLTYLYGSQEDFNCKVFLYGKNQTGDYVSVEAGNISYGVGYYKTAIVSLKDVKLATIERVGIRFNNSPQGTTDYTALQNDSETKPMLANFRFNLETDKVGEVEFKANDLDVQFYNGAGLSGVLNGKRASRTYNRQIAYGQDTDTVADSEYKYTTSRISVGNHVIYMLEEPINIRDYDKLTLELLAWPQVAEGTYLKETATEYTYTILPYNASENENGLNFTLKARKWTDCVIPLEQFADDEGYVSKFIILYSANNAEGHEEDDQNRYSINLALHDSLLESDPANASHGLYVNRDLAQATSGNSYKWSVSQDEAKVVNANNEKIYNGQMGTLSDKNYCFNVRECNNTDNLYYITYGFPEINLVNYAKDTTAGREMILSQPIHVKYFSTFTFEIGMKVNNSTFNHGSNKDFGCKVYFYGTDSKGKDVSVEAKDITYGVGFYTTVTVELAPTNLTKIKRVAFELDYSTEGSEDYTNISESGASAKTILANFRFNEKEAEKTELTLKANDLDVLFYNGAAMGGVLENKVPTPIFWTNGASAAFGLPPVDNTEYKYMTTRISTGSYMVYMLKEPVKAADYKDLTLQLLAWPQGADANQGYLKETATEYTYTILPYNADRNEGGLNFTVAAKTWTDCVIPLEQFADEDGYVSKFIILYSANNADGHVTDDQSKYTINFALHDSKLEEVKEEEEAPIPEGTMDTSFGLYVKEELATQTAGKTYTWSALENSKVVNANGAKINKIDKMDTRSDNNYRFNVRECNSTDNAYYVSFGFPEINLINYEEDTTKGCEMIFAEAVKVKNFSTFTFEIGMRLADDAKHERRGSNKDFKCTVYAYGSNGTEKVSVPIKEVSYGLDFYTTVVVELEKTGLESIERIAFELPFDSTNTKGYSELTNKDKVILADFKFNAGYENKSELLLKANNLDVLFYNGGLMAGVLENKAPTSIFWTNGASAAFGLSPVDNTEYKYMTTRISTGSYMVYMLKEPVKAADYKDLTLQLLAWPQGADANQGYLKETATEFTYTILPYNADRNEGGLNFTVAAKTWTDCVIPLEQFADEDGYVSKFVILYSANNADGHMTDDQSKYTINFALHDSYLGEAKEVEEVPIPIGNMDTSFGLYVKKELATQTTGKTYTWSTLGNSKVLNTHGAKINKIDKMDTRSDNNYRFNVRECNSKDNAYYVAFGFPEINLINYEEDTTKGCEMVFTEAVKVKNFSTFTFEIGMRLADDAKHERRGSNKDFKCTVYAYGSNGKEKVSVPIKEVSYGLDFYTTVVVELEKTGLKSIERIAFELPFDSTNTKGYPELTGKDKVILADFKFNDGLEKKPELLLKANNLDVLFYNGGLMAGVLENKAPTSIFWTNGASAAFGLSPVDNTEYKYMTTRISTGTYMVYMLKEPVNIKDYHNLTLKLLAWPQGADEKQGYLKETATEFTYSILPYNATKNSGGLQFTLSARQWTDCKIPLEMFADEDGYVSKFIILYAGNNAEGHTVKDQSKYTMNFALYDSVLDNIDQTEMVFTYIEKPIITETKISFRLKSTTMFGAGEKLTDSLAESISINGKTIKSLINEKKVAIKLNGNFVEVVLDKSEFKFDDTDCIEIKKGATVKTYKNGRKLINTDDEKFVYSTTLERFEVDVDWEQVKNNSKRGAIEQIEIAQNAESVFNGETLKMSSIWVHFKDGAKKNYDTFNVHLNLQEFAKASGCSDLLTYHYAQNGMFESVMDKMVVNGKSLREWLIEDKQAGNSGMIRVEYLPFSISQGKIMRIVVSEKSLLKIGEGVDQSIEFKEGFTNPNLQQIPDNTYFEISATEAIANAKFSNINPNDVEIQNVDMEFEQDKTESVSWFAKYGIAVTISGITLIVVIGVIAFWLFRKKRGEC